MLAAYPGVCAAAVAARPNATGDLHLKYSFVIDDE